MAKNQRNKFFGSRLGSNLMAPLAAFAQLAGMSPPAMNAGVMGEIARAELLQATESTGWNIRGDVLGMVARHATGPAMNLYYEDEEDETGQVGYSVTPEGVALINVAGILIDAEPSWWMSYLGYCSTPQIARNVRGATADENVKKIALITRSPGGSVSSLADACNAVWEARQVKKIYCVASLMCSAAFEIGSQCDYRYLTEDGMAGCIGTLIALRDWSGYYSQMGIVTHLIASDGAETYKGAGTPGAVVTKEHKDDFKRQTNEFRELFNGIIQRGMGWDDKKMTTLADGRTFVGKNAVALGIADEIATFDAALAKIGASDTQVSGGSDNSPPDGDEEEASDKSAGTGAVENAVTPPAPVENADNSPTPTDSTTNINQTAESEESPQEKTMPTFEDFVAWCKGEGKEADKGAGNTGTPAAPANTAAPAVDPKDAEIERLKAENQGLSQFRETQLTQVRKDAEAAAVTAYKQGTDALKNAQVVINSLTDVTALRSYIQQMEAEKPAGLSGNGQRNSESEDAAPDVSQSGAQTDAEFYANIATEQRARLNAGSTNKQETVFGKLLNAGSEGGK